MFSLYLFWVCSSLCENNFIKDQCMLGFLWDAERWKCFGLSAGLWIIKALMDFFSNPDVPECYSAFSSPACVLTCGRMQLWLTPSSCMSWNAIPSSTLHLIFILLFFLSRTQSSSSSVVSAKTRTIHKILNIWCSAFVLLNPQTNLKCCLTSIDHFEH